MIIVSDASPIIFLLKLKRLDILLDLYKAILLPKEVHGEIIKKLENHESSYMASFDIFEIVEVEGSLDIGNLGLGENKAILLAKNKNADLMLIDDKHARIICEQMGLKVIGTLGILYKSFREKAISKKEFIGLIDELIGKCNFRISIELYNRIMREMDR